MSYSELLAKAEYKGKGKRIGTPGNYRYIYPRSGSKKSKKPKEEKEKPEKKGLMSKIFGGLKKLWKRGDKPSDNAKAALEGMAQDEKVVEAVRESKDKEGLQHLEEMLKAHGAEIKELKAELRNRNSGQQQQQQQQQPKKKSLLALLLEAVRAALSKLGGTDKKVEESKDEEKAEESKDEEKAEESKDDKKVEKGFTMGYSELLSKSLETSSEAADHNKAAKYHRKAEKAHMTPSTGFRAGIHNASLEEAAHAAKMRDK